MFSAYITSLHALSKAPSRAQSEYAVYIQTKHDTVLVSQLFLAAADRFIALGLIGTTAVAYLGWAGMTKTRESSNHYARVGPSFVARVSLRSRWCRR